MRSRYRSAGYAIEELRNLRRPSSPSNSASRQSYATLSLFPKDRPVPAEALDSVQMKLSEMQVRRARPGEGPLGSSTRTAGSHRLNEHRLIDPGSEFQLYHEWFDHSATDILRGADFVVAEKDRLYRCLDRVREH